MAHPIYSFIDKNEKIRFYQIWDTISGYPHTVPMCLLNLLQYKGLKNMEVAQTLYLFYDRLSSTGSTMADDTFSSMPIIFKQQAYDFVNLKSDPLSQEEKEINQGLENLLAQKVSFFEFFIQYQSFIQGISPYPKRQQNYYFSWSHLMTYAIDDSRIEVFIKEVFKEYNIPTISRSTWVNGLDHWFKKGVFGRYPDAMKRLFYLLAYHNLICIDSIPHIYRDDPNISKLFHDYGTEGLLPSYHITYEIRKPTPFEWVSVDDIKSRRQYLNLQTFHLNPQNDLMGRVLSEMSHSDLLKLVDRSPQAILNMVDPYGNYRLPMMYNAFFDLDTSLPFLFLDCFNIQNVYIYDRDGFPLDKRIFYDIYVFSPKVFYAQLNQGLNWIRCSYQQENNTILESPFDYPGFPNREDFKKHESQSQIQSSTHKAITKEAHNLDFEMLRLISSKEVNTDVYLFLKEPMTEVQIKQALTKELYTFTNNQHSEKETTITLYDRILRNQHYDNPFEPAYLNVFKIEKTPTGMTLELSENYTPSILSDYSVPNDILRTVSSTHCLELQADHADISLVYRVFFKVSQLPQEFKNHCENYLIKKPQKVSENSWVFKERFVKHLIKLGHQEQLCLVQKIDEKSIQDLLKTFDGHLFQGDNFHEDGLPF